ncbi:hypothetical protein GA0074696_4777 [Micromonospora purpureochromogenes]|uniref:Uncharacterized protein n=1 Tax=Micromonospora purpureochromogenes TaxID=47872 RepID=A0A1C4ZRS7_9ACTN|nr:hypothetical protein [Micromonospora purpureochromogenes]SCF35506.1 hypothetical protein GA0074696_4777 [Micromonospora purpureochromogenes]
MQRDRRSARLSLASLDFLGSDTELRTQAHQAYLKTDCRQAPGTHTGQDRTGSVTVLIDAHRDVEDVSIAQNWRSQLGVGGLADALFQAYTAALHTALEASALQELQTDQDTPPTTPASDANQDDHADEEHLWLRRTWRTLHEIDADLQQLAQEPNVDAEQAISGPHGCLTLRLRGGSIVAITQDVARIAHMDAGQVQFEARSLFGTYTLARVRNRS